MNKIVCLIEVLLYVLYVKLNKGILTLISYTKVVCCSVFYNLLKVAHGDLRKLCIKAYLKIFIYHHVIIEVKHLCS